MVMPMVIPVEKNSSPRYWLHCQPNDTPFDFKGANPVNLILKASPDVADPAPSLWFPGNGIAVLEPLDAGILQLDLPASLTQTTRYFKLTATKGFVVQVLALGLLRVMNC